MRKVFPIFRSSKTIVQQMNTQCTRDVLIQLAKGVTNLDINPGSPARSYDFEDQSKVDFDAPYLGESSSLIQQSMRSKELYDHMHPTSTSDSTRSADSTSQSDSTRSADSTSPSDSTRSADSTQA